VYPLTQRDPSATFVGASDAANSMPVVTAPMNSKSFSAAYNSTGTACFFLLKTKNLQLKTDYCMDKRIASAD